VVDAARRGSTDHRDMDAAPVSADISGAPMSSAGRTFLADARIALTALNWTRYRVLSRMFGVSREQANLLTFVLALNAANATHDVLQRILRHPWPLSGGDTGIAVFLVREAGFGIAGPKAREVRLFGALIAVAAIGGVTRPGIRRALHSLHVAEQRFVQERRRIYGAAQQAGTGFGRRSGWRDGARATS
jgi:hypothetical protein